MQKPMMGTAAPRVPRGGWFPPMLLLTSAVMQVRRQVESYRQAPRLERAIRNHEARTSVGARD